MARPITAFRFPLAVAPELGGLARESDYEDYVAQLIRQVLLTSPGERVNRPEFGAGIRGLLFAPNGVATASLADAVIRQALDTWLGTIIVVDNVVARADGGRLDIQVTYTIRARQTRRVLTLEVTL